MRTVIRYSDYYIPHNFFSIEEYVTALDDSFLDKDVNKDDLISIFKNTIGIQKIYIEERKNEVKIFSQMLEKYFTNGNTQPEEIDFIIYTRGDSVAIGDPWSLKEEECINVPYFLQRKFGFNNAQIFNVEQECSGILIAIKLASSLIKDNSARRILLLSRNFFESPEKRLMGGAIIVSDGLGIMEISKDDSGLMINDFVGTTDGSISMVKDFTKGMNPAKLVQIGSELIKFLVAKNNLKMNNISRIIPQNMNKSGWNLYCQVLNFPKENVFLENFTDGGHMGDVDTIRNITDVQRKNLIPSNEYAIAYGVGTGTSWNALLLQMS